MSFRRLKFEFNGRVNVYEFDARELTSYDIRLRQHGTNNDCVQIFQKTPIATSCLSIQEN